MFEQGEDAAAIMRITSGAGGVFSGEGGGEGEGEGETLGEGAGETDLMGELESFKSILEMWSLEDEDMASIASAHTMVCEG